MTEQNYQLISFVFEIIADVLPIIVAVLSAWYGIPFVKNIYKNKKHQNLYNICEVIYFAIKNEKRHWRINNSDKMPTMLVKQKVDALLKEELNKRNINIDEAELKLIETYFNSIHQKNKKEYGKECNCHKNKVSEDKNKKKLLVEKLIEK